MAARYFFDRRLSKRPPTLLQLTNHTLSVCVEPAGKALQWSFATEWNDNNKSDVESFENFNVKKKKNQGIYEANQVVDNTRHYEYQYPKLKWLCKLSR